MEGSNYPIIAALDIGTTHSGHAYTFCSQQDLKEIKCSYWSFDDGLLISNKTSTCILLNKMREFECFGYEAEEKYAELCVEGDQDDFYFIKHFTSELYKYKNISRKMILEDVSGKCIPTCLVFEMFINALANHLIQRIKSESTWQNIVSKREIRWIFPISSDLLDTDIRFLKSCVEKTGIPPDNIQFVTKEEAAFVYCQKLKGQDHNQKPLDGTICMLVDLGGFADVAVLENKTDHLIEMYKTTSNECGGKAMHKQFVQFLEEILGTSAIKTLKAKKQSDFLNLEREFEIRKKYFTSEIEKIILRIPLTIDEIFDEKGERLRDYLGTSKYNTQISMVGGKLRIVTDFFFKILYPTIRHIILMMEKVIHHAHAITDIIMTGGVSCYSFVQDAVKKTFSTKRIFIPEDPDLAVLKGAVLLGLQPCRYIRSPNIKMTGAQTTITKCIFCDNDGIYYCNECKSAFCQQCRKNHDKLPTIKNHTVTDMNKVDHSAFSSSPVCLFHKSEFIYYCTKCHVLICGKCVTTEHKGHDISDIKTVADSCRREAEKTISQLKEEVVKVEKVVEKMMETEEPAIISHHDSALTEITQTANKIAKAVNMRTEIKRDEVEDKFQMEKEEFQYKLANKKRVFKQHKETYEQMLRLMNVSHDITFITSYETLKRDIIDINDCVDERPQEQLYEIDKKMLVQEVVNSIVCDFEMRLVGMEDGTVVVMDKKEIQEQKDKEQKQ